MLSPAHTHPHTQVKGFANVINGKVFNNEAKIQAGEALLEGRDPAAPPVDSVGGLDGVAPGNGPALGGHH